MDDLIDPIYGNQIVDPYVLGKTVYSLMSLYDWFLVRKCLINPMTNNLLTSREQLDIIDKFKDNGLLPDINYGKMTSHRVVLIMEKYRSILEEVECIRTKIYKLENNRKVIEDKLLRARKREKHEEKIRKIGEKITNYNKNIEKLKSFKV